jgi:hypothetical protein
MNKTALPRMTRIGADQAKAYERTPTGIPNVWFGPEESAFLRVIRGDGLWGRSRE